ncbi:hypothetical protein PV327_010116 [Microctonus hyperodae]|uniref:BTB domain-containing protein n=1 Tax=Microctonus hyperodae TaxID=165561 RepID=A0AA39FR74_MICHY|nr:hypothetical protein PV327_010116 [Microctonus hyperodae]
MSAVPIVGVLQQSQYRVQMRVLLTQEVGCRRIRSITFKAHRLILAACSKHFQELFEGMPPSPAGLIVILDGTSAHNMTSLLEFMYRGEVHVSQESLSSFLKAAEYLQRGVEEYVYLSLYSNACNPLTYNDPFPHDIVASAGQFYNLSRGLRNEEVEDDTSVECQLSVSMARIGTPRGVRKENGRLS